MLTRTIPTSMFRCGGAALVRATLRGAASTLDVAYVTRTQIHLSIHPQSCLPGQALSSARAFATRTVTRAQKSKSSSRRATSSTRNRTTATKKKAKKAVPKPKPKKKKVLSEKAKAALERSKALVALKTLRATALVEPKGKPDSAWTVYVSEQLQGKSGKVTDAIKSAAVDFKSLSASEREHYNHIANQNKSANQQAYTAWVASHTAEQVRTANLARQALKRKVAQKKAPKAAARSLSPIKDDRQVKRPQSAFLKFNVERRGSGDFQGIKLGDSAKLITKEWNELSAAQKKKYEDLYAADKERYAREYQRAYGKAPPSSAKDSS